MPKLSHTATRHDFRKGIHLITCCRMKGSEITQQHDSLVHLKLFFSKAGARINMTTNQELGWLEIVASVLDNIRIGRAILHVVDVPSSNAQARPTWERAEKRRGGKERVRLCKHRWTKYNQ